MTPAERVTDLKRRAIAQCLGCRVSWRLDGWTHRAVPGFCERLERTAQPARQELRDIARAVRK